LAPCDVAVFPLQGDDRLESKAREIAGSIKGYIVLYDRSGSIGKRYARMDEIGTPLCITVDFDTVDEKSDNFGTVTVRNRDDRSQERVKVSELQEYLHKRLS
ncbi:MAG: His/Gly/Thr/Pro-type tRNA ligase C-terminal domain-containing protein, partial [Candidatus Micrarchaeaceae archaeon]